MIKINKTEVLLIIILFLNILLRIPSLLEPIWYGDECIYLTLAHGFNKGLVFYRDIHDNKPPLLYLIAALAQAKLFWFRLITIAWNTLNIIVVFILAKKIFKKQLAVITAFFLFFLFSFLPEGRIANGEIFMIMPASLGVLLAITAKKKNHLLWFLSGLCFSFAFLFKIPIAFDFAGLLVAFFLFPIKKINDLLILIKDKRIYLILLGFFLPILLTIIYYSQKGAFTPYVRSALMQNIGYLSSWSGTNWGLYLRGLILIIVTLFFYLWRRKLGFNFYLFSLMSLYGLFGIFLSERPYPHYLIEIAPWTALLIAVFLIEKKVVQIISIGLLIILAGAGVIKYKFWWYPTIPYYKNFINFTLGKINQDDYFSFFAETKVLNDYKVASYLQKNSLENDRIFIWGDGSCIYATAKRLPVGRYAVNYHIFDFNGFSETIQAIKNQQPKIIIKLASESRSFSQLDSIISKYYAHAIDIGEAKIYHRVLSF